MRRGTRRHDAYAESSKTKAFPVARTLCFDRGVGASGNRNERMCYR